MRHRLALLALLFVVPFAMAAPPRAIPGINAKDVTRPPASIAT